MLCWFRQLKIHMHGFKVFVVFGMLIHFAIEGLTVDAYSVKIQEMYLCYGRSKVRCKHFLKRLNWNHYFLLYTHLFIQNMFCLVAATEALAMVSNLIENGPKNQKMFVHTFKYTNLSIFTKSILGTNHHYRSPIHTSPNIYRFIVTIIPNGSNWVRKAKDECYWSPTRHVLVISLFLPYVVVPPRSNFRNFTVALLNVSGCWWIVKLPLPRC